MPRVAFANEGLPAYHEGMLLLKARPTMTSLAPSFASQRVGEPLLQSPGMSALSVFERSGMVRGVTPLARPADTGDTQRAATRTPSAAAIVAGNAGGPSTSDPNAGVSLIELEPEADLSALQGALANDPQIEFVSRVPVRYLAVGGEAPEQVDEPKTEVAAVPPPASTMWNLAKIGWPQVRVQHGFKSATNIRVAVLDTGIEENHPDLRGRVSQYVYSHPDLPLASGEKDIIGHGTHVTGTIGALVNGDIGINGICESQLLVWKIFDDQPDLVANILGPPSFNYYVEPVMYRRALADCVDLGVDVVNLSISGRGRPDPQERALFNALLENGTVVVAAMGNERREGSPTSYPAAIPGVIAVGATSLNDTVADFSNRGNHISVSAPGVAIWSTLPTYPGQLGFEAIRGPGGQWIEGKPLSRETAYDAWQGTSMAAPHVTAAVALLLANKGNMNAAAARQRLMETTDQVTGMGASAFHPDYGAGRLNLLKLLDDQ